MEWPQLGWIDLGLIALAMLSILAGLARGFTFEVLSLAGWFLAWFAALWFGPWLGQHIGFGPPDGALNRGLAYAGAFFAVLIAWGFAARAASSLIGATPLRPLDRLLGALFGAARAVLIVLAVVTLVGFTPIAESAAWRSSRGVQWAAELLHALLPLVAPEPAGAAAAQYV